MEMHQRPIIDTPSGYRQSRQTARALVGINYVVARRGEVVVHFLGARDSTCAPTGGFDENIQGDDFAWVCVGLAFRGVCWGADGVCVGLRTQVGYVC